MNPQQATARCSLLTRNRLQLHLLLAGAALLAARAQAQAPSPPRNSTLQQRLAQLATAASDLETRLPNFACRETLLSQERRGDKLKNEVRAAGDLRIERAAGGNLVEHLQGTERNGKPFSGPSLKLPIFLFGGFKNVLDYFLPQVQPCFVFNLSGDRVDFETAPHADPGACSRQLGTSGFALLDPAGDITHLERHVQDAAARARNAAPYVATDLEQVDLGGRSFYLARHVLADVSVGPSQLHWDATYSSCRLFHVSVTLGDPALADPTLADPTPTPRPVH
ncbi:MAG: hypothetical protein M3O02_08095 [Acidobacteriota bacterium]|nr:hypothetical protein [Acidobacteriota bacterium]